MDRFVRDLWRAGCSTKVAEVRLHMGKIASRSIELKLTENTHTNRESYDSCAAHSAQGTDTLLLVENLDRPRENQKPKKTKQKKGEITDPNPSDLLHSMFF